MRKLLLTMLAITVLAGFCQASDARVRRAVDYIQSQLGYAYGGNAGNDYDPWEYEGKNTMVYMGQNDNGDQEVVNVKWKAKDGTPTMCAWYHMDTHDTLETVPPIVAEEGSVLRFYFADGDSLTLRCMEYADLKLQAKGVNTYTNKYYEDYSLRAYYPLTEQDMERLKADTIAAFRLELSGRTVASKIEWEQMKEKLRKLFNELDIEKMLFNTKMQQE